MFYMSFLLSILTIFVLFLLFLYYKIYFFLLFLFPNLFTSQNLRTFAPYYVVFERKKYLTIYLIN